MFSRITSKISYSKDNNCRGGRERRWLAKPKTPGSKPQLLCSIINACPYEKLDVIVVSENLGDTCVN
jgi:hypothetical protein